MDCQLSFSLLFSHNENDLLISYCFVHHAWSVYCLRRCIFLFGGPDDSELMMPRSPFCSLLATVEGILYCLV